MINDELRDWAIILLVLSFLYGIWNGLVATIILFIVTVVVFMVTKKRLEEQQKKKLAELTVSIEKLFENKHGGKK